MARPEFENQVIISAVTSKRQKIIENSSVVPFPTGSYERFTIFSSPNTTGKLLNFQMVFEAVTEGGATGQKSLIIDCMLDETRGLGMFAIDGTYNAVLRYDQGTPKGATAYLPNDLGAISNQVDRVVFDDVRGMQVVFMNVTGVTTTAKRSYILFVEEEVTNR